MTRLRDYILENTRIDTLIALPHLAFQVTGANNEGNLIFFTKVEKPPAEYQVYIDWAGYVGFDTTGRKIERNDLHDILTRMEKREKRNLISISRIKEEGRFDPWFFHPKYDEIITSMAKSRYPLLPISEVVKPTERRYVAKDWWEEPNKFIETNDVDLIAGEIVSSKEILGKTAPNRARIILDEGDFLIPNARDCVRGIAVVPGRCQGWVCSNRFFVVKPDKNKVEPLYLYHVLRQVEVLALLKRQATGEINPGLGIEALGKVFIPIPEQKDTQLRIVEQIRKKEEEKNRLLAEVKKQDDSISVLVRESVPSNQIPREKFDELGYDYVNEI